MNSARRVLLGVNTLAAIIIIGIIGYAVIEGWSFVDALFMTVITITTVGYGEVHPLSPAGRIFSIFLIFGGVGGSIYTLTGIIEYILAGHVGNTLWRRRMQARITKLKGHFIVCGLGRVGEDIARTFVEESAPFVIIDNSPERIAHAEQAGYLYVEGDATSDEVLREAGIEQARGLVAAVGGDAENTYITLSARGLRPDLFIEARASSHEAEKKLERAGANRIVSPNSIGARRMAMLALRPAVVDFIDNVSQRSGPDLLMENVAISNNSSLAGQTIAAFRQCSKANILAVSKKSGELIANPPDEEKILPGDSLIIVGTSQQLASLESICEGVKPNE